MAAFTTYMPITSDFRIDGIRGTRISNHRTLDAAVARIDRDYRRLRRQPGMQHAYIERVVYDATGKIVHTFGCCVSSGPAAPRGGCTGIIRPPQRDTTMTIASYTNSPIIPAASTDLDAALRELAAERQLSANYLEQRNAIMAQRDDLKESLRCLLGAAKAIDKAAYAVGIANIDVGLFKGLEAAIEYAGRHKEL